jgi:signal transduction histidine kinase
VPEKDPGGRTVGWLGTYTDCDDLKRALAAAEATRGRLETLAEASAHLAGSLGQLEGLGHVAELCVPRLADWCVIELWDADGRAERVITVHADPAGQAILERLTTLHPAGRRDGGWLSSAPRRGQPELVRNLTDDARRALAHDGEHARLLHELAPASFMAVPLRAREHLLGALTIGTSASARRYDADDLSTVLDLAHRAAMAVDNSRLYREAQQAIALRDEFLSIASHELRTPLTALQLQLQTLLRMVEGGEPRLRDKAEKSIKQTRRLEKLVENLLDVTRIIGGRLTLEPEEVDLAETVRDVAERFTDEAARASCPIRVNALAAPVGRWDRLRLEQVATNLISNAVKYAAGAPIDVRVEQADACARLVVADHGQGIPPEALGRIFGRFERAADRPHYGGLGLGLYIVRHIVEAHGGSIRAASEPGRGATFTVELPLAPGPAR